MRLVRALKFQAALAVLIGTVWVTAWERHITALASGAFRPDATYTADAYQDEADAAQPTLLTADQGSP